MPIINMVYKKKTIKPKTFTISWTEQSNMSSGWTYSDDAAGLTAGDTAFDEFFGYSGVRLSTAGVETAEVTQTSSGGAGKLKITDLGTLTSGDNVMIKFPVRGIKMTKSGSVVTLSITDGLGRENVGYQYYAHCAGTLTNPGTPKNAFYLGAYEGYLSSNVLKSWSGQSPADGSSQDSFCTYAKANGSGYNIIGFYQRMYINALYIMKYGNPNSQGVVGQGYIGGKSAPTTGGTNSQTNATYGTSSKTTQVKLFGLEDWWGGLDEWIGGAYTDGNKQLFTTLSDWSGTIGGGEGTGTTISTTGTGEISSIAGNNKAMFAPIATVDNSSYNTYYSDSSYVAASRAVYAGGTFREAYHAGAGSSAGAFNVRVYYSASSGSYTLGSRLMYL